jgi:GNAT superfamily N-acetyltransferase
MFDGDERPETFHLAALDGNPPSVIGIATLLPHATVLRMSAVRPFQLRGMAVHPDRQGRGIGRLMLDGAFERLRLIEADVLWANARDEALGFYRTMGMEVIGDGFLTETGRPHHTVVLDL